MRIQRIFRLLARNVLLVGVVFCALAVVAYLYFKDSYFIRHFPEPYVPLGLRWAAYLGSILLYSFGSSVWFWLGCCICLSIGLVSAQAFWHRMAIGLGAIALGWSLYGAAAGYLACGDPWFAGCAWIPTGGRLGSLMLQAICACCDLAFAYAVAFALVFCGLVVMVRLTHVAVVGRFGIWALWPLLALMWQGVCVPGKAVRVLFLRTRLGAWLSVRKQRNLPHEVLDVDFWQEFVSDSEVDGVALALDQIAGTVGESADEPFSLPPKNLFIARAVTREQGAGMQQEIRSRSTVLQEKLDRFGIQGSVVRTERGPVVTLFEYAPAPDIKVSRISALTDDVALALGAMSLRVIAPIPGKQVVGFEVANEQRQVVLFSEIFESTAYQSFAGSVPAVIGVLSNGEPCIVDLVEQPHMLLAGSTGSGKSVVMHALILGMLGACTPDMLRLVMIDPKRLEFAPYADIPHLLVPIVTEVAKISQVFSWLVRLMEERYAQLAAAGVRSVEEYRAQKGADSMPVIVVCVDELADIMVTVGNEVEPLLIRLAQMARAAAIHLIVATQRPSVDVITGILKVNFPTRIGLKVASKVDSRTILDMTGAEQLLGKGDMLFMQQGGLVVRAHGAFVQSKEVHAVAAYLRLQQRPVYETIAIETDQVGGAIQDALYPEIVAFIKQRKEVSISLVQRQFRIGFNRSARLIELLEKDGYVTGSGSGKMRRVL